MHSPFHHWNPVSRQHTAVVLSVLLVAVTIWLRVMDGTLQASTGGASILAFEFAGDAATARQMMAAWGAEGRALALLIQGVDFLYLVVYPLWLSLVLHGLSGRVHGLWRTLGVTLSWGVLAAGVLDAVENGAMNQQLLYGADDTWAALAWWCAALKFGLLAVAALVAVLLLAWGVARRR